MQHLHQRKARDSFSGCDVCYDLLNFGVAIVRFIGNAFLKEGEGR
jgi:hypothetical protein